MGHISEHLPEAIKPNLVLQKQELKGQRVGEVEIFRKAIHSPQIRQSSPESLDQSLRLVMVKCGLRAVNWPSKDEKFILIDHIITNYGGNRIEEIKLAFDMAISGKLDIDANCYENFSCLYFSNIMNAYRDWAKQELETIQEVVAEKKIDKLTINIEYACYKQKEINKLPVVFKF